MSLYDASDAYRNAKFATDWSRGLLWYAENERSMSICHPVEYYALEIMADEIERTERDAFDELQWYENEARIVQRQGHCSTPSRYL